jgi:hypothetical protein
MTHIALDTHRTVLDVFHDSAAYCTGYMQKLSAAFGAHSTFTYHQKIYHGAKLTGIGGLMLASVFTWNVEGVIAGGFAIGDEILKVEEAGENALNSMPNSKLS